MADTETVEAIARLFHVTYELRAPAFGWKTQEGPKAWEDVAPANRGLMRETVARLLDLDAIRPGPFIREGAVNLTPDTAVSDGPSAPSDQAIGGL